MRPRFSVLKCHAGAILCWHDCLRMASLIKRLKCENGKLLFFFLKILDFGAVLYYSGNLGELDR